MVRLAEASGRGVECLMHELGIVLELFELLDEIAAEQQLTVIHSVTLEVGELCGILPDYLTECWKAASLGGAYEQTQLKLTVLPAVALCACGKTYEMMKNNRTCPYCGKSVYTVQSGREFTVKEIEAG